MNREDFKAFNEKMFGGGIADVQIDCISLQGSSSPSTVTALEWAMHLKLNVEIPQLAPGVGAGEKVTLVGTSLIWWNEEGKVCRQSEHGRVAWPNIDIEKMRKVRCIWICVMVLCVDSLLTVFGLALPSLQVRHPSAASIDLGR